MHSSSVVDLGTCNTSVVSPGPAGYILAYGLAYKNVVHEGNVLAELPACTFSQCRPRCLCYQMCILARLPTDTGYGSDGVRHCGRRA